MRCKNESSVLSTWGLGCEVTTELTALRSLINTTPKLIHRNRQHGASQSRVGKVGEERNGDEVREA